MERWPTSEQCTHFHAIKNSRSFCLFVCFDFDDSPQLLLLFPWEMKRIKLWRHHFCCSRLICMNVSCVQEWFGIFCMIFSYRYELNIETERARVEQLIETETKSDFDAPSNRFIYSFSTYIQQYKSIRIGKLMLNSWCVQINELKCWRLKFIHWRFIYRHRHINSLFSFSFFCCSSHSFIQGLDLLR